MTKAIQFEECDANAAAKSYTADYINFVNVQSTFFA